MKTSTTLNEQTVTQLKTLDESYEIIENEQVSDRIFSNLTVAGALFSLSNFNHCSFSSCAFYACKWENSTFRGCHFENCTFEFTNLYAITFISCTFKNCTWEYSHCKKSEAESCELDRMTSKNFSKEESNVIVQCFTPEVEDMTQRSIEIIELYDQWFAA